MHPFHCSCGQTVFFENTLCQSCGAALGYSPGRDAMLALPAEPAVPSVPRCANDFCNWLVEDGAAHCLACRLTRTIPDLAVPGNRESWIKIEQAKKQVVVQLLALGLPPQPKQDDSDALGLAFDLLADVAGAPNVLTGHADGVITLNVAEADDVAREAIRTALGEPMRTLLGHLRHEVAHYLQYRWLAGDEAAMARCREVFGDERADYAEALARHHGEGPPPDWQSHFISAYASAHPWEDWAETCAHTLLVVDAVETAAAWGLRLDGQAARTRLTGPIAEKPVDDVVLEHWLPVAQFLNAMNRSLGLRDSYPFLMPDAVLAKMATVQALLRAAAARRAQAPAADAPA
ncbi:putative zinc-binding metallopeptidase [Propionivibrio sp.]|uniref:zinc-binding metallopeptidase family protein n=1 Tax=Propionivibrio sp. TaxID=2212460 RepID=UPI0039E53AE9